MTESSNPGVAAEGGEDLPPVVDISGAVGHPSSEVVDSDAPDTGAVTDAPARSGEQGLTGTDVAAVRGGLPVDVGRGHRDIDRPD